MLNALRHLCRPLRKQGDGRKFPGIRDVEVGGGNRQNPETVDEFSGDAERRLTRRQYAYSACLQEQRGQRRGQRMDEVLRAVENQQQRNVLDRLAQCREFLDPLGERNPECQRNCRGHAVDLIDGCQGDPRDGGLRIFGFTRQNLLGEPGLADAGNSHDGHQARSADGVLNVAHVLLAAQQGSEPVRPCASLGAKRKSRRLRGRSGNPRPTVRCRTRHFKLEPIAKPLDGANGAHAENAPQACNLCRDVVLIDDEPRPDLLEQRGLGDEPAAVLHEQEQHVEGARAKLHGPPRRAQSPLGRIEFEIS